MAAGAMVNRRRAVSSRKLSSYSFCVIFLTPKAALAAGGALGASPEAVSAPFAGGYLAQLLGGLLLVVVMILALAWLVRRLPGGLHQGGRLIEVLAVRSLSARERLVLVEVGGEQLLLGVTANGIRHLHTLTTRVEPGAVAAADDFATLLRRAGTTLTGTRRRAAPEKGT